MAALRLLIASLLSVLLAGIWQSGLAVEDLTEAEYRIKAAFLYKFGDYVQWPQSAFASPSGTFQIGVIGADTLADQLEQIVAGHTMADHPVIVRKLKAGEALNGLHLVFIGRSQGAKLTPLLDTLRGRPVLTVTESDSDTAGVINFVVVDDKVRFDVLLPTAEEDSLKISARLLTVARRVIKGGS
jgi:hypothetical protein